MQQLTQLLIFLCHYIRGIFCLDFLQLIMYLKLQWCLRQLIRKRKKDWMYVQDGLVLNPTSQIRQAKS